MFAKGLAKILSLSLKRERSVALAQLHYVFGPGDHNNVLEQAYQNSILTIIEAFRIRSIVGAPKQDGLKNPLFVTQLGKIKAEGVECVQQIIDENSSAICLGSHFSNFELMTAFFSYQGLKITIPARKANSKLNQDFLEMLRSDYNAEMLWREDQGGASNLLRALKKNRFLAALIDQDVNLENEFVPFFGLEASYPVSLIKMGVRLKKPFLFVSIIRTKNHSFKLRVFRIPWEEKEDPISFILEFYSKHLEELILEDPSQWVWWHRRWRRRPEINYIEEPNKLRSTSEYVNWLKSLGHYQKP